MLFTLAFLATARITRFFSDDILAAPIRRWWKNHAPGRITKQLITCPWCLSIWLSITVPAAYQERGTYIIPGHGRLCDEADLSEFREMITIVRDRVQAMINDKKTLQQVQASRPALDYSTTYGGKNGGPTAEAFVETVYKSLTAPPKGAN